MRIKILPLFVVLIAACAVVKAQSPMSDEKRRLIGEMVSVLKMDTMAQQMTDETLKGMETTFPMGFNQAIDSTPGLTTAERSELKRRENESFARISTKFRERMKTEIDFKKYINDSVYPLYDKFYSEEELRDIIQFYKTPTGKRLIETMPQIFAESQQIAQRILLPQVLPIITSIVEEEFKSLSRSGPRKTN